MADCGGGGGPVCVAFGSFVFWSTGGCGWWLAIMAVVPVVPHSPFFWRVCSSAPLLAVLAVSAAPWLVVAPSPAGGRCTPVQGGAFFCPGGGPVAVVVRLLWLGPVAGLGWVVS